MNIPKKYEQVKVYFHVWSFLDKPTWHQVRSVKILGPPFSPNDCWLSALSNAGRPSWASERVLTRVPQNWWFISWFLVINMAIWGYYSILDLVFRHSHDTHDTMKVVSKADRWGLTTLDPVWIWKSCEWSWLRMCCLILIGCECFFFPYIYDYTYAYTQYDNIHIMWTISHWLDL